MATFTAEQAIRKIKAEKTDFMGHIVTRYNYAIEVREQLTRMSERGELAPAEYYRALAITWPQLSDSERRAEADQLDK
jgi:hypothetical protein